LKSLVRRMVFVVFCELNQSHGESPLHVYLRNYAFLGAPL
jgi:hypothetical protein